MCFDEAEMGVHGQILAHGNIRVESHSRQAKAPRLVYRVINQLSSKTFTLPGRLDGDVVYEVRVALRPTNEIAIDYSGSLDHHDMVRGDRRDEVGHH
jgi:hypothetical protein